MIYYDKRIWKFDSADQTTAPNQIPVNIGFNGLVAMDFTGLMSSDDSIASITSASFADITGTEPTISASAVSSNKQLAVLTLATASATANTYTASVKVLTVDGETLVGKGLLVVS